ncbi:hypothetical protein GCM10022222_84100 [Amycolatopsis ultiminotia]|uniref:PPE family protein n=2 Tax=Amycolatopsis ultiminotia TaxID=543629 RepID=A0ABP6YQT5_9PSEU
MEQHQPPSVPIDQIVRQVQAGNPAGWHQGLADSRQMATDQEALSQDMTQILGRLEPAWSGAAAGQVSSRLQKVRASMIDAHQTFLDNNATHTNNTTMYENLRNQLAPMPGKPSLAPGQTADWSNYDYLAKAMAYSDASEKNLATYQSFVDQSRGNSGQLKYDYGTVGAYDGGDVSLNHQPGSTAQPDGPRSAGGGTQSPPGGAGGSPAYSGGPSSVPGQSGGTGGYPGAGPHPGGDSTTTSSVGQPGYPDVPGTVGTGTGTGFGSGGSGPGNSGPGGSGGLGGFSPGGLGPGTGTGGGAGRFGGTGPGTPGGGAGSGARGNNPGAGARGNGPGAGARTGTGVESPGVRPGAAGRVGAAGERGMSSAGAPGGRGGKKDEDEEHERKYVLDVDLFADDKSAVDPVTGLRPTPPTLGT